MKRHIQRHIFNFVTTWLLLTSVALAMYWILWLIIDPVAFIVSVYALVLDSTYCLALTLLVMLLCGMLMSLFDRIMKSRRHMMMLMACLVAMNVLVVRGVESALSQASGYYHAGNQERLEQLFILSIIAIFFTVVIIIDRHYKLLNIERERTRKMELTALKRQLDPHFMFNSLNTLDGLIEENPEQAHTYLARLAQIYRYITGHVAEETVILRESIEFTKAYAELIEIRHPGHFIIRIDSDLDQCTDRILPMSLQTLVENAVKHNRHSQEQPVEIHIYRDEDYVVVRNTLRPNNIGKRSVNIGLENLQRRYRLTTHRNCIVNQNADGFFEVKIPILTTERRKPQSTTFKSSVFFSL